MPLKSKTAWSHLKTVKCATEIVNSWPDWKRDIIISRPGKPRVMNPTEAVHAESIISNKTDATQHTADDQSDGLRKRSA
jgi:hypothetical protein